MTPERQCLRPAARWVVGRGAPVRVRAADDVRAFVAVSVVVAIVADVVNCIQTKVIRERHTEEKNRYARAQILQRDADLQFPYRYSNTNTRCPR